MAGGAGGRIDSAGQAVNGAALYATLTPTLLAVAAMQTIALPHQPTPYWSSRAPALAAMLLPTWLAAAMLPGFCDIARDLPLTAGGPNLWAVAAALPPIRDLPLTALATAAALGVAAALLAQVAICPPRRDRAWATALLATLALPGLLPASELIAFAPAALVALIDAWARRDDTIVRWTAAGLLAAAIGFPALGALAIVRATWLAARVAIVLPANDNASPLGPRRLYPPPGTL